MDERQSPGRPEAVTPSPLLAPGWLMALLLAWGPPAEARVAPPVRPRRDWQGDPLPRGAVARIGSARWLHHGPCRAYAFSRKGDVIVSADDRAIRFWDVATGKELRSFPARVTAEGRLPLAPDGSFVVAAAYEDVVLHDTATGKARWHIRWSGPSFWRAALSPDGKTLALGRNNGLVTLHDTATGKVLRKLPEPTHQTGALAFSPDGKLLAVGDGGSARPEAEVWVRVYEVKTGKLRDRLEFHQVAVEDLVFLPGGRRLGVAGFDSEVLVWDLTTGRHEWRYRHKARPVFGLAISPEGRLLATSGDEGVRLWDLRTGRMVREILSEDHLGNVPTFSPDGSLLALCGTHPGLALFRVATGKAAYRPPGPRAESRHLAVSPDGKVLATGSTSGEVFLWDMDTGRRRARLLGPRAGVSISRLRFSDGRLLTVVEYVPGKDGSDLLVRVLDLPGGKERFAPLWFEGRWPFVALAPRGDLLAARQGGDFVLYDLRTGKPRRTLAGAAGRDYPECAFSPDGKHLAVPRSGRGPRRGASREVVQLWDVRGGKIEDTFPTGEVRGTLSFTPGGRRLFHVEPSREELCVHDLWRKGRVRKLRLPGAEGGGGVVHRLSPDGNWLARAVPASVGEPFVQLYEMASGQCVLEITDLRGGAEDVTFTPDGKRIVTGGCVPLVWDLLDLARAPAARGGEPWADLGHPDAAVAFGTVCRLARAPDEALPLLEKKLRPTPGPDVARVRNLITRLDSDEFAERQAASRDLAALGARAEPFLRAAARDARLSLEARRRAEKLLAPLERLPLPAGDLREGRAVQVLEWIGSARARRLLRRLAGGDPSAPLTRQADLALRRLERSPAGRGGP